MFHILTYITMKMHKGHIVPSLPCVKICDYMSGTTAFYNIDIMYIIIDIMVFQCSGRNFKAI